MNQYLIKLISVKDTKFSYELNKFILVISVKDFRTIIPIFKDKS